MQVSKYAFTRREGTTLFVLTLLQFQALDYFQTGRAHLLLISEHPGTGKGALGIVSRKYCKLSSIKKQLLMLLSLTQLKI